ncbi:PASTA domain-containing protein, partial [Glutamicibacter arilaitensis]
IIRIPSLSGMLQSQAVAQLDDQGIPVRIGTAYDDEIAIGRVVDSQPGIGENIMKFQGVDLIVSQGPELFEVPDLTGKSLEQATTVLNEIGFQDLKTDQAYSESLDKGEVISSSPAAGKELPRKNIITLTVSKGHAPVEVPSLTGLSKDAAQEKLESLGLKLNTADSIHSAVVEKGLIAAQDPATGTIEYGSTVSVNVSEGPEYVEIPSVIGQSVDEATAILEAAGFTVKNHNVFGGFSQTVRMQSPLNQQAVRGSEISIYAF